MPLHPVIASVLVLASLGAVAVATKAGSARWNWHPELPRKLIHVGMGLICLSFPWIFEDPLPVQILAGLAVLTLSVVRFVPTLRNSVGTTLYGVSRHSIGELAFPAAVGVVFTFAHETPALYLIPLLLLTVADAAGALAGIRYGKTRYSTTEGFKSVEGSLSFLFLAFLCAHLPLLLGTDTGRLECILIALTLALLTMMAEAISTRGFDNFVIPVAGLFLLQIFIDLPAEALAIRLAVLLLLLAFVMMARSWSTLQGSALLAATLLGYGCFALGDWRFVLPPLSLFLSHLVKTHRLHIAKDLVHGTDAISSVALSAVPWLLAKAAGFVEPTTALLAFAGSFATHLAIMHCSTDLWAGKTNPGLLAGVAKGITLTVLPILLIVRFEPDAMGSSLLAILIALGPITAPTLLASAGYNALRRGFGDPDTPMWYAEGGLAFAASVALLGILHLPFYS